MRSLIIKDIEMPQNCAECDLSIRRISSMGDIIDCKRIGTVGSAFNDPHMILINRHPNCPLVEIPPHGDLTDKDKLIQEFMDSGLDHLQRDDWKEVIQIVSDADVIIEAEGSEE
jgi:hypothetical protein